MVGRATSTRENTEGAGARGYPDNGEKIKLRSLFREDRVSEEAPSPVYGEKEVTIRYAVHDLLWRPVGSIVRFVIVIHPSRGNPRVGSSILSLGTNKI